MGARQNGIVGLVLFSLGCLPSADDVQFNMSVSEYITGTSSTPVEVYVDFRTSHFHLDAYADGKVAVDRILDPSGQVVMDYRDFPAPRLLSQGLLALGASTSFNWPIRLEDEELTSGYWTVEVAAIDDDQHYISGLPLVVHTQFKSDENLGRGRIRARVLYDEETSSDALTKAATEQAMSTWQAIFRSMGLTVDVTYEETTLAFDLDLPGDDTFAYEALDGEGEAEVITILVGHYIGGGLDKLGITGAIPGAIAESPKGVVLISWLALAGKDAEFDSFEIGLFGETVAHEVGHYLGLFHPVEEDWVNWDYVSDTQECADLQGCEDILGENLMFPYPVCDGITCVPQRELTAGQQGLIHGYTGTL